MVFYTEVLDRFRDYPMVRADYLTYQAVKVILSGRGSGKSVLSIISLPYVK